jgi:2-polyprenyl-3-methyl-5-hydroxy-6-metoxy-1,4-benzoquinol methylase
MDTFGIKDDDINVEEIMRQIRENIKKRKESGVYTQEMEDLVKEPLNSPSISARHGDLQSELDYINSNWNVNAEYVISSHRPLLGRPLIWGRRLIHGEVKRYVNLIASKQTEFNAALVQVFNRLVNKLDQLNENEKELPAKINKEVDDKLYGLFTTINKDIENKAWLADLLDKRHKLHQESLKNESGQNNIDLNYFIFKENIGKAWNKLSGETIPGAPNIFDDSLEIFKGCRNVLEIGCGEGTFLQKMKDSDIGGYGIDLNEDLILYCRRKGLKAEIHDALTHLRSLNDKALDGVFAAHVIEHMQLYELKQLLEVTYAKMQFGSNIILVIPNILNMTVSSNTFYMDPTHINHLHPEVIKFLLESCGFRDIQERFYQPVPDEMKLRKIEFNPDIEHKKIYETMNYNIDLMNNLLFGYRDFAVIAKK